MFGQSSILGRDVLQYIITVLPVQIHVNGERDPLSLKHVDASGHIYIL